MYVPSSNSDLTKKVPTTLMVKVKMLKIITQEYRPILLEN